MLGLGLALFVPQDASQDWPQFMGPNGTSEVELEELDFQWGEQGPEILWTSELGGGYGGVAVRDGEVFLLDREIGEMDIMRVLDLKTGEDLWDQAYEAEGRLQYPGSRSVPAVTEDFVITMGGHGDVACYGRDSKVLKWKVNVAEKYGGELPGYGWSNSPLVLGNKVIVSALGEDVGLAALDIKTGKELWATGPFGVSHSTPVFFNLCGVDQILFLSARTRAKDRQSPGILSISSFDPETGAPLWEQGVTGTPYPIPRPIQIDAERIFVTGGYAGGSSMLKLSKSDEGFQLEEQYHMPAGSQLHSPILHNDYLYFIVNENSNHRRNLRKTGGMLCMGLDGKEMWRTGDDPFFGRGNWVMGGDYLFIQDGFNGALTVCKASPEGFEPLAQSNLFEVTDRKDHEMWSPMALVDGKLLLRSKEELICVNLRRGAE